MAFDLNVYTIKKDYTEEQNKQEKVHYLYVMRKRHEAEEIDNDIFSKVYKELEDQELEDDFNDDDEENYDKEELITIEKEIVDEKLS